MAGCSLVAPGLVSAVNGLQPTFAYNYTRPHDDYFGLQVTYMTGKSTCYGVNSIPTFTPIIQNRQAKYTETCQFLTTTSYTGIFCTDAKIKNFPSIGELTISPDGFKGQGSTKPLPFVALFGTEPPLVSSTITVSTTVSTTTTSTARTPLVVTSTVYRAGATNTTTTTASTVFKVTDTYTTSINSCPTSTSSSTTSSSTSSSTTSSSTTTSYTSTFTPVCPAIQVQVVTVGGRDYQIECGIDRTDSDIGSAIYPGSYEECLVACNQTPNCVQISYSPSGPCYLKNDVGFPNRNGGIIGGRWLGGPPDPFPTNAASITPTTTSDAQVSTLAFETTYMSTTYGCMCLPTGAPFTNSDALACPGAHGRTYTTDCGAEYAIECGTDRTGNDILGSLAYANSLAECLDACNMQPSCVDVSYVPGSPGPCYLKNAVGPTRQNSHISGGRQLSKCQVQAKLYRKRVAPAPQPSRLASVEKRAVHHVAHHGVAYNPDFTYVERSTVVTTTSSIKSTISTEVTPKPTTTTVTQLTVAIITVTTTTQSRSTTTTTVSVTTCPRR